MTVFKIVLEKKLLQSQNNSFGIDNHDEYRFGRLQVVNTSRPDIFIRIKTLVKRIIGYRYREILDRQNEFLNKYEDGLQRIYDQLDNRGQELLVDLIAYRMLGYTKVKLPRNNKEYWDAVEMANSLEDRNDTYDPRFLHFILLKCNLQKTGYDITIFSGGLGIAINFILEQYAYKIEDKTYVGVEKGDVILDIGACWGDTSLYFACKTGEQGKVYSFEFVPGNIKLFNLNISLNPKLIKQIELIQHPVSNNSGDIIYFFDNGPGSRAEKEPFDGQTGLTTSISIDDFVINNNLTKVDFIKMDIEGSERIALQGAIETIKRFKPKLAIAIYHSIDDFVNIPNWISELNLGYKLYLGHYTIHLEETIIFAKVEE
jgi:FkbM family methyltransferase